MLKTETVRYEQDGFRAVITISEANGLIASKQARLKRAAIEERQAAKTRPDFVEDVDFWSLRVVAYPDAMAASISIEIDDVECVPDFLTFASDFPQRFLDVWIDAIYRMNPHWISASAHAEEQ